MSINTKAVEPKTYPRRYKGPKLEGKRTMIRRGDAEYPPSFERLNKPPGCLYVVGNIDALQEGLAVIGARKATPYGQACAKRFAGRAASRGIAIISGGAMGCDSCAHRATIDEGGITVAILGGGCDELYPASNHELFQAIVDADGAVVSEYEWGFPPMKFGFRARNRLIACLARATLIVEAGLPSGTFSTADEALAANRDVLVVPGSIMSASSRGANRLIYQGATPIVDDESFDDILFDLYGVLRQEASEGQIRVSKDPLLAALQASPLYMEDMLDIGAPNAEGKDPVPALMIHLAFLIEKGLVARFPDGRYGSVV